MIKIEHLNKSFGKNTILNDLCLDLPNHGIYLLTGDNGSGKSTLLYILGLLDTSYMGRLYLDGIDVRCLTKNKLDKLRREKIGFVFPKGNLLNDISIFENRAFNVKGPVRNFDNLSDDKKPIALSGGEEILLSISNELSKKRPICLFDEVSSSLDSEHLNQINKILKSESDSHLFIMATHDERIISSNLGINLQIQDGKIKQLS
ncbi:MAG: ATP-binding cassette domain-containing protein [Bacilli bacterium]